VALEQAGVTNRTPNPAGGQIDKDPDSGEPTGLLREARDIIEAHIPSPSLEERKQMVLAAQEDGLRNGITGVHTCESLQEWEAFAALEAEGKLKVRVYHLLPPKDLAEAADRGITAGFGSERLEHVQLCRPQDLTLFNELGVVAPVQPVFIPTDWAPADKRWGPQRCRYAHAWKSLLQAGLRLQFGSDAPVETINPIYGIHAAVTRQTVLGEPSGGWIPEQKLSLIGWN
jgi:predicted amidohydrolase YtcJ